MLELSVMKKSVFALRGAREFPNALSKVGYTLFYNRSRSVLLLQIAKHEEGNGGATREVMAQKDTDAPHVRITCPQVIDQLVNGRLVGTRTPDLHRVNSNTADAQPCNEEHQAAPMDKT